MMPSCSSFIKMKEKRRFSGHENVFKVCGRGKTNKRKPEKEKEENWKVLKKPRAKSVSRREGQGQPSVGAAARLSTSQSR